MLCCLSSHRITLAFQEHNPKVTFETMSYIDDLCAVNLFIQEKLPGLSPALDLSPLKTESRVKAFADMLIANSFNSSILRHLSLKDVRIRPEVMQLVCTALQSATLQKLDLTNCGLTNGASECLLPLVKSSCLRVLLLGGNNFVSDGLLRVIQECNSDLMCLNIIDGLSSNAFVRDDIGVLQCPHELQLSSLKTSALRIETLAEVMLAKRIGCSILRSLSMRDVRAPPDVMELLCTALQSPALQKLDLTNCGLRDNAAGALLLLLKSSCLTDLQLGGNHLSSMALNHAIQECNPGLTSLNLENSDALMQLPPGMTALTKLTSLCIDGCYEMYYLPTWLKDMTAITTLSLRKCAIQYMPSYFSIDQIREFLSSASRNGRLWQRLKVVFLGNGRSGKTSLLRALAKLPLCSEEQSTRGVNVDSFADNLKPNVFDKWCDGFNIELSYWDFAGQLEYSASHEFFMSNKQAVYVIVFSVMDDRESQQQQLLYWLSSIARQFLQRLVRVMIVGTKIDLLFDFFLDKARSESKSEAHAASKFNAALASMRRMISDVFEEMNVGPTISFGSRENVIREKRYSPVIASKEVLFVTSNTKFRVQLAAANGSAPRTLDFDQIRRALKVCLYSTCEDIFKNIDEDALKYPLKYFEMKSHVEALKTELLAHKKIPCCSLWDDDPLVVKHLGKMDPANSAKYVQGSECIEVLKVLSNLGIVVVYEVNSRPWLCAQPQYLSSVMSLLADPQSTITAATTREKVLKELQQQHLITLCLNRESAEELLHMLISVGIIIPAQDDGAQLTVPLALRGRPTSRKEVHELQQAHVMGRRLGCSTSRVPASAFLRLMTSKCRFSGRMWGCAFVYNLERGGCVYVRLLEDRSKVDVVVMSSDGDSASDEVST